MAHTLKEKTRLITLIKGAGDEKLAFMIAVDAKKPVVALQKGALNKTALQDKLAEFSDNKSKKPEVVNSGLLTYQSNIITLYCQKSGDKTLKKQFLAYFKAAPKVDLPTKDIRFPGETQAENLEEPGGESDDADNGEKGKEEQEGEETLEVAVSEPKPKVGEPKPVASQPNLKLDALKKRLAEVTGQLRGVELPTDPETVKGLVGRVLSKAKNGDFKGATSSLDELEALARVARLKKSGPEMKKLDVELGTLNGGLDNLASSAEDGRKRVENLRVLYAKAKEDGDAEFARKIIASCREAAKPSGPVDQGAPLDDEQCKKIIKEKHGWTNVKKEYLAKPARMKELKDYRKKYVDTLLTMLGSGKVIAKSVGSDNLTSDYDVTLACKDDPGAEIAVARAFNNKVQEDFGAPPGVIFDTNLYVKDFLKVTGNVIGGGEEDSAIDPVTSFTVSDDSDQDVGSLMKQRQYMQADEWKDYEDGIKTGLANSPEKLREVTLQFQEADALYLLNMREKADRFFKKLKDAKPKVERSQHLQELENWFDELPAKVGPGTKHDPALDSEMQRKLDELAQVSQHDAEDLALAANNEIYLEKMEAVRKLQKKHRDLDKMAVIIGNTKEPDKKLKAIKAIVERLYPLPTTEMSKQEAALAIQHRKDSLDSLALYERNPDLDLDFWLKMKIEALKEQSKKQIAEANFHASEAYLSEGALGHVVGGVQSNDKSALDKITPQQFLQSMNEQFGDFLKDAGHYGSDDGKAFVQTAKYLQRMVQSLHLMLEKVGLTDLVSSIPAPYNDSATFDTKVKPLLDIRGAKDDYGKMTDEERWLTGYGIAKDFYGVGTIADLRAQVVAINGMITAAVRSKMELRPSDTDNAIFSSRRDKQHADMSV